MLTANFIDKIQPNNIVMSSSARKSSLNRDIVNDNQTLFDFLKRKKQYNLENTVNKSLLQQSSTKRKVDIELEDSFPQTRDLTRNGAYDSGKHSYTARQTITPRKIQFEDSRSVEKSAHKQKVVVQADNGNQHRRGKSFISMIFPLKGRPNSVLEERNDYKQNEVQPKSILKMGKSQNFTRRNVTKSINSIKDTVNYLNQNVKKIQQKAHGLVVLFNPLFSSIDNPSEQLSKTIGDLRNKLKSFETLIEGSAINNCDDLVEGFHKTLEEHLQGQLQYLRKQIEKEKQEQIQSQRREKQVQIEKLQLQLKKVSKERDTIGRQLQLIESNKQKIEEQVTEREMNHIEKLDRYKSSSEALIEQLKVKNSQLQRKLEVAVEQAKQSQKRYKNERMVKQSLENKYKQQIQQIIEAKDAYLLNEIMVLKTEFNADMAKINELHKLKQKQLLDRIAKRETEIDKKIFQTGCDRQIEAKILQEASVIKQENMQLKTKSECLITDMYRMNEQLYQHWLALKDIKSLSVRLGSFPQFKKIYQDLMFNEHLFH